MRETTKQALACLGSVSYVSLIRLSDRRPVLLRATLLRTGARFYLCTYSDAREVGFLDTTCIYAIQLDLPEAGGSGYVELCGKLRQVMSWPEKRVVVEIAGSLGDYWQGIEDPHLTMYELQARTGVYLAPGTSETREFMLA